MLLSELLAGIPLAVGPTDDVPVEGIATDSREVRPGFLFIARDGARHRGVDFIPAAIRAGAVAVLANAIPDDCPVPFAVASVDEALIARIAAVLLDDPTADLVVFGITGTNGKTSVTWMLEHILLALGERPALLGTVGYRFGTRIRRAAPNTTPDALTIQSFAREVCDAGATCLVLEVSSHGLALGRVTGVLWDAIGFTNLTPDHLDFHVTPEAYRDAKRLLFGPCAEVALRNGKRVGASVMRGPAGDAMLEAAAPGLRVLRAATAAGEGDVTVVVQHRAAAHTDVAITWNGVTVPLRLPLVGDHNCENAAVALGMIATQWPDRVLQAVEALRTFPGVPGRLELAVDAGYAGRPVLVDYAHSPDAVERALAAVSASGDVDVVVLGCGGDRDRIKRPAMARAAALGAHRVVLTADNPRSEDPAEILAEMRPGVPEDRRLRVHEQPDRSAAIFEAVGTPGSGAVVIAGKGHEPFQEIQGRRFHLDDREEARRAVRAHRLGRPMADVEIVAGWSIDRIADLLDAAVVQRGVVRPLGPWVTDHRTIEPGDIFVALRGARLDGHAFVSDAVRAGAALVIVERLPDERLPHGVSAILVPSTARALQLLAAAVLDEARSRQGGLWTVAITGSNGKTTTKELTGAIAGRVSRTLVTPGNWNNHIGLPLTVARVAPAHRTAVLEMGANQPNDIRELARIAGNDVGVVTSIGTAHAEGLGGIAGVRATKAGILESGRTRWGVIPHDEQQHDHWGACFAPQGVLPTPLGPPGTRATPEKHPGGQDRPVALRGRAVLDGFDADVALPLPGDHNASNLAAAVLALSLHEAGRVEPPPPDLICEAVAGVVLPGGRLRRIRVGGRIVIDDAYNANPSSMAASLGLLRAAAPPRVAVLGDMNELGTDEARLHREVGVVATSAADMIVTVGTRARWISEGVADSAWRGVHAHFDVRDDAAEFLLRHTPSDATLLLKGSRSMGLESIADALVRAWGGG